MTIQIDEQKIIQSLDQTVNNLDRALQVGRDAAPNIDCIYMITHRSPSILVCRFHGSGSGSPKLNDRTLVLLVSKSGKTPETPEAADFVKGKCYKTVAFTQFEGSPLALRCDEAFHFGETTETFLAIFMLMQTLVGAVLECKEQWPLLAQLLSSFAALPKAFVSAAQQNEARAKEDAMVYKDIDHLYLVAAGPGDVNANVFGPCILTEMLKIQAHPIKASEFFHSTLEIVNNNTPLLLILSEDPSRPLMERVEKFCKEHAGRVMIYDSRDYEMKGIDPEIRPLVAPYIVQAALKRLSVRLFVVRGTELAKRVYMGKVSY